MNYKRLTADFIHLESVDSTNNYAANLLKETKPANGTTILTKRQTAGKGQRGNSWQAEAGLNLTFSLIIYPDLVVRQVFYLNMIASLAICRALELYTPDVSIKWPNDVFADNRKIAGILIENQFRGDRIASSILGIGINVNQQHFDESVRATSLRLLKGEDSSLETVFKDCYTYLDFYLDLLMDQHYALISKLYHNQLLGMDETLQFNDAAGDFEGIIKGVDEDGKLKLMRDGGIKKYDLKEVKFLL